jgi:hypothetical protein
MFNILVLVLSYALPSLNKVYSVSLVFPLLGNQNIEFERLKHNISQVRLRGLINSNGYVYNNENTENIEKTIRASHSLNKIVEDLSTGKDDTAESGEQSAENEA